MHSMSPLPRRTAVPDGTWLVFGLAWCLAGLTGEASDLEARWMAGDLPLVLGRTEVTNAHGQSVTFSRWDVLLSNVAFHRPDGGWLARTNWVAVLEAFGDSTEIGLGLPPGTYDRVRFDLGLSPDMNARDAAQWPPEHPLNPARSSLHWGWAGGWVFAAVEGRWRDSTQSGSGFSFHLAGDALRTPVERPLAIASDGRSRVIVTFDVSHFVAGLPRLELGKSATHSRDGDRLAPALMQALAGSIRVDTRRALAAESGVGDKGTPESGGPGGVAVSRATTAPGAHPYRLQIPAAFPRPALPVDNPLTEEGVRLGRFLFYEPLLSRDGRLSCAGCHDPARGFTDGRAVSTGVAGRQGTRSSMPLFNLAWKSSFFWDGRARTLREQVLQPITNPAEMDESLPGVLGKLRRASGYPAAFREAFGTEEIDADRLARALEQFLLVQVAGDSRFDQVMRGEAKFTQEEARGFQLFHTEFDPTRGLRGADCFHCHGGALFVSQRFGNNGLPARGGDPGRAAVTGRPADKALFSVPSLRQVAKTAPYMHDGRFDTLEEVVKHYCEGIVSGPTLDPNLAKHPAGSLGLGDDEQQALVAFLRTL